MHHYRKDSIINRNMETSCSDRSNLRLGLKILLSYVLLKFPGCIFRKDSLHSEVVSIETSSKHKTSNSNIKHTNMFRVLTS